MHASLEEKWRRLIAGVGPFLYVITVEEAFAADQLSLQIMFSQLPIVSRIIHWHLPTILSSLVPIELMWQKDSNAPCRE